MLKDYQTKQLEKISLVSEQTQALQIIQPSMVTLLDYQIKRLEGALGNKLNLERRSENAITTWRKTLDLLKEARKLYA